ncbi:MAG: hypothetical protein H6709_13900 [Kofleriaceae bacterium]|nr:hypothetical protein [Kofleriaceae bacterium]
MRRAAARLAAAPLAWLLERAGDAASDGAAEREADLWRAVGAAAAAADPAARAAAIDALARRAGEVADYERRYRIVGALAAIDDGAAVAALTSLLGGLGDGGGTPAALRQVAAAGLARVRADGAASLLAALAADGDPASGSPRWRRSPGATTSAPPAGRRRRRRRRRRARPRRGRPRAGDRAGRRPLA